MYHKYLYMAFSTGDDLPPELVAKILATRWASMREDANDQRAPREQDHRLLLGAGQAPSPASSGAVCGPSRPTASVSRSCMVLGTPSVGP
jgi:hypothetical protein